MRGNLRDIDKLFRDAINGHIEKPPVGVWEAIDNILDKNKVAEIKRKYSRLKKISLALLILLLGTGLYTWSTLKTTNELAKNYNLKINALNSGAATLTQSRGEPVKNIVPNTTNQEVSQAIDREIKAAGKMKAGKNGSAMPAELAQNTSYLDQTGQTIKGISPADNKIINNNGTEKTVMSYAGYGEEENKPGDPFTIKKNLKGIVNLSAMRVIKRETPALESRAISKKTKFRGSIIFPNGFAGLAGADQTRKLKKAASFTATIFFGPAISSNRIRDGKRKSVSWRQDDNWDKIRNGEQHQFSSTFGILIDYHMNKRWSLESGISSSSKTIHINPKTIYADVDNYGAVRYLYNCSSGYLFLSSDSYANPAIGDSIQAFESTNTLQYASVPLAIKYNFSVKNIDLFTSGASVNFLIKDKIETRIGDGPNKVVSVSKKINGLQPSYLAAGVGIGASYAISRKMAVSFLPSYNFALTSSTKDATVKTYPNILSFAMGLRYKL